MWGNRIWIFSLVPYSSKGFLNSALGKRCASLFFFLDWGSTYHILEHKVFQTLTPDNTYQVYSGQSVQSVR